MKTLKDTLKDLEIYVDFDYSIFNNPQTKEVIVDFDEYSMMINIKATQYADSSYYSEYDNSWSDNNANWSDVEIISVEIFDNDGIQIETPNNIEKLLNFII